MAEEPEIKTCSGKWWGKHWKKFFIIFLIVSIIIYVVIDTLTKSCTLVEKESIRYMRISCDPATGPLVKNATTNNQTLILCSTTAAPQWTLDPPSDPTRCVQTSACIAVTVGDFLTWIQTNVAIGVFAFMLMYIIATVCFIPGSILTIGAGATFTGALGLGYGTLLGSLAVWMGASIGSCLAFLLGKYLLRDFVASLVQRFKIIKAIDRAINEKGFLTILLLRFSPLIPYNVFNYIMGATNVSLKSYAFASVLGMLPATVCYVFIGGAIAATATTASGGEMLDCEPQDSTPQVILLVVGILMTIVAVVLISCVAKKELAKLVDTETVMLENTAEAEDQEANVNVHMMIAEEQETKDSSGALNHAST